jgi:hypothetical protein
MPYHSLVKTEIIRYNINKPRKNEVISMATTTFDKKIVVRDNKAADILIKGLSQKKKTASNEDMDVINELKRSRQLLKK